MKSQNRLFRGALLLGLALSTAGAYAVVVDEVAATVDTEVILRSEVMAELAPLVAGAQGTLSDQDVQTKAREVLQQAIDNKILLREAQLAGAKVPDERIEEQLDKFKKDYPTNEAFMKELEAAGETVADLRTRLKKQLLAVSMAAQKREAFEKEVVVSESEVAQYYADHKDQFQHQERSRCSQIFLAASSDAAPRAAAKARLEKLKEDLDSGADFGQLAAAHSEAPGAKEGGIIGWVQHGDLVKELENAAFTLPEGGVSGVLESPGGFHIIKVLKKEAPGLASLDDARAEIGPAIRKKAGEERYQKWLAELRKRSHVQVYM
ncbi:MAG: peptidylprolyl isomerase [Candidatus Hydrogenedentes bacterium]|nr:peptidylprolyl isomerase [Candidatus Hydrogenedentota bacterium]